MRVGFRTLKRMVCALVIVFMLVAGVGVEAFAHGKGKHKGRRGNQGRHLGWERGRHRGWEHSRSRHVRDDDWWENRRERRRRALRRRALLRQRRLDSLEARRNRHVADFNRDGFVSLRERRLYQRRLLAARLYRGF
jgi:hypothetical protein